MDKFNYTEVPCLHRTAQKKLEIQGLVVREHAVQQLLC
jgi:hypothetical protein